MSINVAQAPLPSDIEKLVQNADPKPTVAEATAGHDAVLEPKFDGWRTIWKVEDTGEVDDDGNAIRRARFWTRKGQELTGGWPAAEAELARVLPAGSCVDGEAVVFEIVNGMPVPKGSNAVASILGSSTAKAALSSGALTLVVFDLLGHGGIDARPLPFGKRRELLEVVFAKGAFAPCVQLSPQLEATDENHDHLLNAGYEGSMVKWIDMPYKSGARGWGWHKLKGTADVDAVVMGYEMGKPGTSWADMIGSVVFGQFNEDGILVERGNCSGRITLDVRKAITANPDAYLGKVFTLRHMGVFPPSPEHPHGAFRHPTFQTWRADKPMEAVTLHDE